MNDVIQANLIGEYAVLNTQIGSNVAYQIDQMNGRLGDNNRVIKFKIQDGNKPHDLTGETVKLWVKDHSGAVKEADGYQDTPGLASGLFTITVGSEFYQAAGQVQAGYLQFIKADGTIVSTVGITFNVLDNPMSVTTEQSQVYISSVDTMIDEAKSNIKTAIDGANANVATLNANIKQSGDNFKSQVDTANGNMASLNTSLTSVKNSIGALNTQVQTIQTGVNTHSIASQDDLQAVDNNAVHLAKNEVITGQKNFTGGLQINGTDVNTLIKSQSLQTDSQGRPTFKGNIIYTGNVTSAPSITLTDSKGGYQITPPTNLNNGPVLQYKIYYYLNGGSGWVKTVTPDQLTGSINIYNDQKGDVWDIYAIAVNSFGESAQSVHVKQVYPAIDANIYTLKYDGSATGGLTRADAAVGLVAGVDGAKNDFDNVGPWAKMTKVTDSNGNVFVRIPKTYIRKQVNGNGQNWSVSLVAPVNIPGGQNGQSMVDTASGWYRPTLFWDYTNNVELPYVDVAAYLATSVNNTLVSKSGLMPTGNLNINQFRQQAVANNNGSTKGYSLIDYATVDLLTALFVVEFGTINSQSIMRGYVDTNGQQSSILNNGQSDGIKGSSGSGPRINNSAVMSYRGVENTWGMYLQWIDGVNFNNNVPYLCADSSKYQSDVYANPYKPVGYTGVGGWVSKLGLDTNSPMFQVSVQANGASDGSTYYGDYNWTGSSTLYWGGNLGSGSYAGLFDLNWSNSSSHAYWYVGSRLIKKAL